MAETVTRRLEKVTKEGNKEEVEDSNEISLRFQAKPATQKVKKPAASNEKEEEYSPSASDEESETTPTAKPENKEEASVEDQKLLAQDITSTFNLVKKQIDRYKKLQRLNSDQAEV